MGLMSTGGAKRDSLRRSLNYGSGLRHVCSLLGYSRWYSSDTSLAASAGGRRRYYPLRIPIIGSTIIWAIWWVTVHLCASGADLPVSLCVMGCITVDADVATRLRIRISNDRRELWPFIEKR